MSQITTADELDGLPMGSIVKVSDESPDSFWLRGGGGLWWTFAAVRGYSSAEMVEEWQYTVLYRPDVPAEPQRVQPSREEVASAFDTHRWKTMGVRSVECECGAILHDPASQPLRMFPADRVFREHLADAILALFEGRES
jgi:hypothetical protein